MIFQIQLCVTLKRGRYTINESKNSVNIMEFCPKCGGIMVPKKKKDGTYLVCSNCGYEIKVKKVEGYKSKENISEDKRLRVSVFEARSSASLTEEERQQLKEEYYEVFLETMAGEEESGEE